MYIPDLPSKNISLILGLMFKGLYISDTLSKKFVPFKTSCLRGCVHPRHTMNDLSGSSPYSGRKTIALS